MKGPLAAAALMMLTACATAVSPPTGQIFESRIYPYSLVLPAGWSAQHGITDEDYFASDGGEFRATFGSGTPEPGQTVADRVAFNRAGEFAGCETDPGQDRPATFGDEPAIRWVFRCGSVSGLAVNTLHGGVSYRLTVTVIGETDTQLGDVMADLLSGFAFSD